MYWTLERKGIRNAVHVFQIPPLYLDFNTIKCESLKNIARGL
jgi:hypothetical protein